MSVKRWAQLLLLVSVSTLLAAVTSSGDSRVAFVVVTVVSHIALVIVGSKAVRR